MDLRRALPTLALLALLVVDLALVVWALWPSSTPPPSSRPPVVASSSSPTPTGSPSSSPSASPSSSSGAAAVRPVPVTRLVTGVDADIAWFADAGSCEEPGRVHVTSDGGGAYSTFPAPGSVTRVRASDADNGFVVGGDDRCRFRLWNTGVAGEEWTEPLSASDAWGRDPDVATRVRRPAGEPVTPCRGSATVLDLAGLRDGVASVACSDGTVRTTTDGGTDWATTFEREGLLALALTGPGRGAFAAVVADCDGVAVARIADGKPGALQCLEGLAPRSGQVSVSVVSGATWLVAGDRILRAQSADASKATFSAAGTWPRG